MGKHRAHVGQAAFSLGASSLPHLGRIDARRMPQSSWFRKRQKTTMGDKGDATMTCRFLPLSPTVDYSVSQMWLLSGVIVVWRVAVRRGYASRCFVPIRASTTLMT